MRGGDIIEFVVNGVVRLRLSAAILDITVYGVMQYLQTISCIFGQLFVENCDSILKIIGIRFMATDNYYH